MRTQWAVRAEGSVGPHRSTGRHSRVVHARWSRRRPQSARAAKVGPTRGTEEGRARRRHPAWPSGTKGAAREHSRASGSEGGREWRARWREGRTR